MSVRIESLSVRYGAIRALDGVSTEALAGRVTAVLGPNAAGKSTLLRCVLGARRPDDGRVLIDDQIAHRASPRSIARLVAYVPQRSSVAARFSASEVVTLGRYALPPRPRRVEQALHELDLDDVADRAYTTLSVGQQQRVALARALVQLEPPGHLVLDEPTAGMDLAHVRLTARLLRERAAAGATVLLATHDLTLAAAVADDAWLLVAGSLLTRGPASEVLTPSRLQTVFGVPFLTMDSSGRSILVPVFPT